MSISSLFEPEKQRKLTAKQAAERFKKCTEGHELIPAEHHAQLGRVTYGTGQRVTFSTNNGRYIYCVRSKFK